MGSTVLPEHNEYLLFSMPSKSMTMCVVCYALEAYMLVIFSM